jgi:hypothetical protein
VSSKNCERVFVLSFCQVKTQQEENAPSADSSLAGALLLRQPPGGEELRLSHPGGGSFVTTSMND